jgi:hypothetical protein
LDSTEASANSERARYLLKLLGRDVAELEKAAARNRFRLLSIKLSSIATAGAILVLVAVTSGEGTIGVTTFVALILGGAVTILNGRDVYRRDKGLLAERMIATMRLTQIKSEMEKHIERGIDALPTKTLDSLFDRLRRTMDHYSAAIDEQRQTPCDPSVPRRTP